MSNEVERRTVMRGGVIAAAAGAVTVVAGTAVAFARRGTADDAPASAAGASPAAPAGATASSPAAGASARVTPTGPVVIAAAAAVPVGSSVTFTGPSGGPAVLLHPSQGTFVAFDAACTHKGCPVTHAAGSGFRCPCHGATFDETGQVTGGPAKTPLASIPVTVTADGKVSTV